MPKLIGNAGGERNTGVVDDWHDVVGDTDRRVRHVRIMHTYSGYFDAFRQALNELIGPFVGLRSQGQG